MRAKKGTDVLAPRPVHPTAVRNHGFFGTTFLRQHMMIDDRWTMNSLTEQYKGMADLLSKRLIFKKLEAIHHRNRCVSESRNLRHQVSDGRAKLQLSLSGNNTKQIRNFLINHKDLQRLYQRMPIHKVVENIDHRTFVMRKERDRLRARLDCLKKRYANKLLEKATLENRIKFQNEYVLEEEIRSRDLRKKLENSKVRMRAIETINNVYKKMIQVLQHDAIFYEPILRSLDKDIEDQGNFIKHILYLGMPAIQRFKRLGEQYRQMEEKSRKSLLAKQQWMASYREEKKGDQPVRNSQVEEPVPTVQRYVRETQSMAVLKTQLEKIEDTIKEVKFVTLCSQAKEIYPRMKSQVENNDKLHKKIENNTLGYQALAIKLKRAQVLEGVLVHNLSDEEMDRLQRIKELKEAIAKEDEYELNTVKYMKNRADFHVLLRCTLWNLNEILRHIDRTPKAAGVAYPNSYLKLPLLKFEMLIMRAVPPDPFEENVETIMHTVKRKVYKLMKAYKQELNKETIERCRNEYHLAYLNSMIPDDVSDEGKTSVQMPGEEEDLLQDVKIMQSVPNRRQIKAQSTKLVETLSKKDD